MELELFESHNGDTHSRKQSFILPYSIKCGATTIVVVVSELPPSSSAGLRQLNPIHTKRTMSTKNFKII